MVHLSFRQLKRLTCGVLSIALLATGTIPATALAASTTSESDRGFSVQVSPSPLVATIKPGERSDLTLQIRNNADHGEALKMELRSFTVNATNGQINLGQKPPQSISDFVTFFNPQFNVDSGQIFSQHVFIDTPADAGFTYTFAIVVAQQKPATAEAGRTALNGSVAIFTLLSVDRPGATSKLELSELKSKRRVYEFLPASFDLTFKNTGNTLVQPRGSVFIQRHSDDKKPLATIPLNETGGYIIPNSNRTLTAEWSDGFPRYIPTVASDGTTTNNLSWGSSDFSKLRFGRYVAKVVAVYNDNGRDVPLQTEVTFWVIPWRIIGGIALLLLFVLIGLFSFFRQSTRTLKQKARKNSKTKKTTPHDSSSSQT